MSRHASSADTRHDRAGFVHQALIYGTDEEFLATAVPFLQAGLAHGDTLLAVTNRPNITLLVDALGSQAEPVEFVDSTEWYRHPARSLTACHDYVAHRRGHRARILGEPLWRGRSPSEIEEWTRYESVLNVAFAGTPIWLLCPYNQRRASPTIVADALRTHPEQVIGTHSYPSPDYTDPAELVAKYQQATLTPPPASALVVPITHPGKLTTVRRVTRARAEHAGLSTLRTEDTTFAVNESATNALQHAGRGTLRIWLTPGNLVCEVTSPAPWSGSPFPGYLHPTRHRHGWGLWLIWRLCDAVEFRPRPTGVTIRMHFAAPYPAPDDPP